MKENKKMEIKLETNLKEVQIQEVFSKERVITYLWMVLFPPYGLYRVWNRGVTFRRSEKWVWTMIAFAYLIYFIKLMITG